MVVNGRLVSSCGKTMPTWRFITRPPWRTMVPGCCLLLAVWVGYPLWNPGRDIRNGLTAAQTVRRHSRTPEGMNFISQRIFSMSSQKTVR